MPTLKPLVPGCCAALLCASFLPGQQFVDTRDLLFGGYAPPVDIDGDGRPDLLGSLNSLNLSRNDGFGRFPRVQSLASGGHHVVATGDFTGNGEVDIVAARLGSAGTGATLVLLRQVAGTFTNQVLAQLPASITRIGKGTAIDYDGDGDLDLVCGVADQPMVLAFNNQGSGAFLDETATRASGLDLFLSVQPVAVDFDADGQKDLVTLDSQLHLLRNTGSAFVDEAAQRFGGIAPLGSDFAMGDLNGDGTSDLVIADGPSVFLNVGGQFLSRPVAGSLGLPLVALGDLDGDGALDAAFPTPAGVEIRYGDGFGTLWAPVITPAIPTRSQAPADLSIVDLDGDGDQDLVTTGGDMLWLRNIGQGRFEPTGQMGVLGSYTRFPAAADIDRDGDADLLGNQSIYRSEPNSDWVQVPWGNTLPQIAAPGNVGDIDGDGDLDIVTSVILRNNGAGLYGRDFQFGYAPVHWGQSHLADLDHDGDLDLATIEGNPNQDVRIYENVGGGTFRLATIAGSAGSARSIDAADADGDGDIDLVIGAPYLTSALLWLNGGNLSFSPQLLPGVYGRVRFVRLVGVIPDLLVDQQFNYAPPKLLRRTGASYVDVTSTALPPVTGWNTLAIGDVDRDGDLDLVDNELLRNDGAGGFRVEEVGLFPAADQLLADVDGDRYPDLLAGGIVLWNREHHVALPRPARIGQNLRVEVSARPGRASGELAVLGLSLARLPHSVFGPLGTLHLARVDAAQVVAIPNGTGLAELDLPVPNVASLVGVEVHFQALQAGPAGLALTNLASTTIE